MKNVLFIIIIFIIGESTTTKLYDILKTIFGLKPELMEQYYQQCYDAIKNWESKPIDVFKSITCYIRLLPIFYEKVQVNKDLFEILINELSNIVKKPELENIIKEKDIEIRMLSISSFLTKTNNQLSVGIYKMLKDSLQKCKYEKYLIYFFSTLLNGNKDTESTNNNTSEKVKKINSPTSTQSPPQSQPVSNNNNYNKKMMSNDTFKMILDDLLSISEEKRDAEIVRCTTDYFLEEAKYNVFILLLLLNSIHLTIISIIIGQY